MLRKSVNLVVSIYGSICIVAAIAAMALPIETKGRGMKVCPENDMIYDKTPIPYNFLGVLLWRRLSPLFVQHNCVIWINMSFLNIIIN